MSKTSFQEKKAESHRLINRILSDLDFSKEPNVRKILEDFISFWLNYQKQPKLTIAFIGQYNAGKSTLIKTLTGNSSIRISSEICTDEVTGYEWEDVLLLDTPGIYAGRTDHDSVTLDYISKSDLIVFVLPNELFNPQGAAFFKKVAVEMQRAGQIILVVNKMSRETGSPDDLLKTIAEVTHPHLPEAFNPCFIDADSYLKAQNPKYAKYKERLIEKSNLLDVQLALEELIQKNKVSARLATPLHRLQENLETILAWCQEAGKLNEDVLELLNRKYLILKASRKRSQYICSSYLNQLECDITILAEKEVISLINTEYQEDIFSKALSESEQTIDSLVQSCVERIAKKIEQESSECIDNLKNLLDSPLGLEIAQEIAEKASFFKSSDDTPKDPNWTWADRNTNYSWSDDIPKFSFNFFDFSSKAFFEMGKFASKASSKFVYDIGKSVLGLKGLKALKFKFFGAPKIAKFLKGFGPFLVGVGFIAECLSEIQEEEAQRKQEQELKECRLYLRNEYQTIAVEIKTNLADKFQEALEFYNQEIEITQQQMSQIEDAEIDKNKLIQIIEIYINQIKTMINDLNS